MGLVRLEICRSGVVVENRVFDSARREFGLVRLALVGGGVGSWQKAEGRAAASRRTPEGWG
jgi:hypothetical protein